MSNIHQLVLNANNQVIPINNGIENFQAHVTVKSDAGAPFHIALIEEAQLTASAPVEYKVATEGIIEVDISNDKRKPENWYMLLKADKENKVTVQIDLITVSPLQEEYVAPAPKKFNWKLILGVIVGVLLIVGGFFFFKKRSKTPTSTPALDFSAASPEPQIEVPDIQLDDDILIKINQLPDL